MIGTVTTSPRETDEWFKLVVESIPHMVWATTPDGTSNYYNQRFLDYLGMTHEQMQNVGGLKAVHPEDQGKVRQTWLEAVRHVREYRAEYRIRHGATGEYRWFEAHAVPSRNELGQVVRWVGTCTDIQDRKLAEAALQASQAVAHAHLAELQTLYSAAPIGLGFVDTQLRYVRVNEALARLAGVPAEDHLGRPVAAVLGPELWARVEPLYRQVLQGETFLNVPVQGTLPTEPGVTRSWLASYHPVRAAGGQIIGIGVAVQDVTEQHRAEEQARAALDKAEKERRRLEAVMQALPVGVAITNRDGGVEQVNEGFERVWGGTPPPAREVAEYEVYRAWWADTGKALQPQEWASAVATQSGRCVLGQLLEIQRFDGRHAFVFNSAAPVFDRAGETVGSAVAILDITELRTAQEALRRSEERFRQIFEHAATGIAIVDAHGNFLQCNPAYSALVGYSEAELSLNVFASLIHPEDREANLRQHRRLAAGEVPFFEIENRYLHKDGHPVWVHKFVSVLRDDAGQPIGSVALVTNVTERVKAQAELRAREAEARARAEELAALMDAVPAVTFIAHDPECRHISSTLATRRLLRADHCPNVSMSAPAAERPTSFRVLKDGRELAPEEMPVQLAAARGADVRDYEWTLAFPDGTSRQLLGNAVPLFDGADKVRGAVGAFVDITERKLAHEALRQSEARLRMAQEAAQLGIHDWNVVANSVRWDARTRELWGVEPDLPITYDVFMAGVHPEDRSSTQAAIDQATDPAGKGHYYAEFRVIHRRDGQARWIAATGHVTFAAGRAVRLVGTVQDITRVREFQAELERLVTERTASLREAMTQMEQFSYSVSHDLRAPLRSMQIFTRALAEDFGPKLPSVARTYVQRIAASAERLDKMVVDVLTLSRLGQAELQLERVDLDWLLQQIIEQYPGMQAPQAEIELAPLPVVRGHEPSLTQAFANLLNNAIKFVPAGVRPQVRIWSEPRNQAFRIWVADNGIGVDPKHQHRLFSMFERIHPNLKYEGTGVGLAIVRKAVERMGGRVGIESDGKTGSRFWVELPREGGDR